MSRRHVTTFGMTCSMRRAAFCVMADGAPPAGACANVVVEAATTSSADRRSTEFMGLAVEGTAKLRRGTRRRQPHWATRRTDGGLESS